MSLFSRGFRGRPRPDVDPARVPPGQYVEDGFPVLGGADPRPRLDTWSFSIQGAVGAPVSWTWTSSIPFRPRRSRRTSTA